MTKFIHQVSIKSRNWKQFMDEIYNATSHDLQKRIRVIEIAQQLFNKIKSFKDLGIDERKFIAGVPNNLTINGAEDWGYFGSMKGAGVFRNKINTNNVQISEALDQIPLTGKVTKDVYDNFICHYQQAFINTTLQNANNLSTATRLLTMKRPDTFVCLDNKNRANLCRDFGIIQARMDYNRYWNEIIETIFQSDWWLNPTPTPNNNNELKISEARAAFLDSLYYE